MRRLALPVAAGVLLAGPTVLAFFAGGYFDGPRATAAAVAWALVFLLAKIGPLPFPASGSGRLALGGLAGLAAWSAVSIAWAPLVAPALDSVQRLLLYLGVLMVAVSVLRDRRAARAVEPVLALGALVAIGYGLAGRLVPGVVDLVAERSYGAGGRLEQPITYWNAEGLLAAMGLILCVRIAGDRSRTAAMRLAASVAPALFGMAVYLSYSRGALAVTGLGLVVLLATAPSWPQLRAIAGGLAAGTLAAVVSSQFGAVASLEGSLSQQERDGAIVLIALLGLMAASAVLAGVWIRAEQGSTRRLGVLPRARSLPALAAVAAGLCVAGLVAGGIVEDADAGESGAPTAARLVSVSSLRYEYWQVGVNEFWRNPVGGTGAGGFRVAWRQERDVRHAVSEVHSLPLEMASELGLPGLVLFGLFVGGVATAGRRAVRQGAPLAPAACAVCSAWLLHATIDWDWQLPAVTLPALILAGGLLAASEQRLPGVAPADWRSSRPSEQEPVIAGAT